MKPTCIREIDDYSILIFGKEHVEVWPVDGSADAPFFILETSDRKTIETCLYVYRKGFDAGEEIGKTEAQKVMRKALGLDA